jgi:hypothetical protein
MENLIQNMTELGYAYVSSDKQKLNETFIFRAANGSEIDLYSMIEESGTRRVKRAQFKKPGDKFFSQLRITDEMVYSPSAVIDVALQKINKTK